MSLTCTPSAAARYESNVMCSSRGCSVCRLTSETPGIRARRGSTWSSISFWYRHSSRTGLSGSTRMSREAAGRPCCPPPALTAGSSASPGRGGAWVRLLMTSSLAVWISVPTAKVRLTKPVPRPMKELMLVRPGVLRRTFSCGSTMLASISSGAAARQKLATEICGSSMVGSNWIGSAAIDVSPNSATNATAAATDGHCRVLKSVRFMVLRCIAGAIRCAGDVGFRTFSYNLME